jgi:hypothetical protein
MFLVQLEENAKISLWKKKTKEAVKEAEKK